MIPLPFTSGNLIYVMEIVLGIIVIGIIFFIFQKRVKGKRDTGIKIYITRPFEDLKKGKTAIFKVTEDPIIPGDYVLIQLPGYEMIWKVKDVKGDKLDLYNRFDRLLGFPKYHVSGKFVGYEEISD